MNEMQEKLDKAASQAKFDRELAAAHDQLKNCQAFVLVTLPRIGNEVEARSQWYFGSMGGPKMALSFYQTAVQAVDMHLQRFVNDFRDFLGMT